MVGVDGWVRLEIPAFGDDDAVLDTAIEWVGKLVPKGADVLIFWRPMKQGALSKVIIKYKNKEAAQ